MRKPIKRTLTLIEVMIVIFIIGLIGGVVGVKLRQSMEKGKAFKTEMAMTKLYDILAFEDIQTPSEIEFEDLKKEIAKSPLTGNAKAILIDGWETPFQFDPEEDGNPRFHSDRYNEYCKKNNKPEAYPWIDEEKKKDKDKTSE